VICTTVLHTINFQQAADCDIQPCTTMSAWTLRCRGPSGQATLGGLSGETTVAGLQALLEERTGVPAARQEVLSGFPPKALKVCCKGRLHTVHAATRAAARVHWSGQCALVTRTQSAASCARALTVSSSRSLSWTKLCLAPHRQSLASQLSARQLAHVLLTVWRRTFDRLATHAAACAIVE
jgi:hypothetical protein